MNFLDYLHELYGLICGISIIICGLCAMGIAANIISEYKSMLANIVLSSLFLISLGISILCNVRDKSLMDMYKETDNETTTISVTETLPVLDTINDIIEGPIELITTTESLTTTEDTTKIITDISTDETNTSSNKSSTEEEIIIIDESEYTGPYDPAAEDTEETENDFDIGYIDDNGKFILE